MPSEVEARPVGPLENQRVTLSKSVTFFLCARFEQGFGVKPIIPFLVLLHEIRFIIRLLQTTLGESSFNILNLRDCLL